jgi:hypothetical protein
MANSKNRCGGMPVKYAARAIFYGQKTDFGARFF